MLMSGRAYSSVWCKLISFVLLTEVYLFFPSFHTAQSSTDEILCTADSQRDGCCGEYHVVVHCLENGMCEQQQTSVFLLKN